MIASPWIILLAVLLYSVVHSLLASLRAKALARRWFGSGADRYYRLGFNLFAGVSLLPVLALVVLLDDRPLYRIPQPWAWLFLTGQLGAVLLLLVGVRDTGVGSFLGLRQLVDPPDAAANPSLVVKGLYRWVRHPLYTAGLLFIWLTPRMTVNILALNIGFTLYLVVGAWVEERKLVLEFGAAYERYRERVPMLIPGLRRNLRR